MTVEELGDRMSSDEFVQWQAFYAWRHAMQEKEAKKVKRGGR